jgi:hypothetical protein
MIRLAIRRSTRSIVTGTVDSRLDQMQAIPEVLAIAGLAGGEVVGVDVVPVHGIRGLRVDQVESVPSRDPQHPDGPGRVRRKLLPGDLVEPPKLPDPRVTHVLLVHIEINPAPRMLRRALAAI